MIVKKILFTVLCLCAAFLLLPATAAEYQDTAERVEILSYTGSNSGWKDISGDFKAVTVKAKNYLPMDKSAESDTNIGYSIVLRVKMDNGKFYAFRIINDTKVRYAYTRFGADGATTGWDGWTWVDSKDTAATELINGKGTEFKVERTSYDVLTVTINGTVFDTYTMDGVTSENKVVSVGFKQYGNPASSSYTVKVHCEATYTPPKVVNVQVADIANGKVIANQSDYIVGETVNLTVVPDSGYAYKTLTVNGVNVKPDINGVYSFVAQDSTYNVSGGFTKAVFEESADDKWNLIYQGVGELVMSEHSSGNSGWLKPLNNVSDITTTVKDYTPSAQDFSMIYRFTFKNGETIGLRLNGTDTDGKYKIQVVSGSTLSKQWANHYTLTSEQIAKVKDSGIKFRVAIEGLNAAVYLDGTKVCDIDLSKVVATGNASYIKNMPVSAELRMDGNLNRTVKIPYEMRNSISPITVTVSNTSNGKITADKTTCEGGDVINLTVVPDSGYAYKTLTVNGTNVIPDINGEYSFVAQENTYIVDGSFIKAVFEENTNDNWNLVYQGVGELVMSEHSSGNSGWLKPLNNVSDVTTTVKDYTPSAQDFSMIYRFTFKNAETIGLRLNGTDTDGKYRIQVMNGSTLSKQWANHYTLTSEQIAKVKDSGIKFRTAIEGLNAAVYLDGTKVCDIDLSKVVATGNASYIKNMPVSAELRMDGNLNRTVKIPYEMRNSISPITVTVSNTSNGKITADKTTCEGGDVINLTVVPDSGYAYKTLTVNGVNVKPDINGVYSFVAQDSTYNVSGGFTKAVFEESADDKWNLIYQGVGELVMSEHSSENSGWLKPLNNVSDITTTVKDYTPSVQDFSMIYKFTFENGETIGLRLNGTDTDGKYKIQVMNGSTLSKQWANHYTLTSEQIDKVKNSGIKFRTAIEGLKAVVYLDGTRVCEIDLSKVVSTGNASYIINIPVRVEFRMDGNLNKTVKIPYELAYNISWTGYQFDTDEIEQYVIVYDDSNPDYATYAKQLADRIKEKYGKTLKITPDTTASVSNCEILLGDTNRSDYQGKIMEYSVTVKDGKFRINVGGSCSAEKAIEYLCNNVFDGQKRTLNNGEYYHVSLLTKNSSVTSGTTARVMSANVLADSFSGGSHKNANYRAEIFAGALISYTPDALGLQETDANWNNVLDSYLVKIEKLYGIKYSRCLATYEGKINYTSLLYRSDKFKVENSGVQVFSWWKDKNFNHNYHMRNITWAQFASLTDPNKKFVLANTHWSYRTEHANGNTYLAGSSTPIATNELRTQCMNETNAFMTGLKEKYSTMPVFLVGDFNTSLPFFTSYGWTPTSFNVISEQAKNNGTALSTVPTSNHFDHIFGTGNYTVKRYEFFNNVNQHSALSDHPFVYADFAF